MPKQRIEKTELLFKRLVTDAGYSEKVADIIWKLYEN